MIAPDLLRGSRIELGFLSFQAPPQGKALAEVRSWMSKEEWERHHRYQVESKRMEDLWSRWIVRRTLARILDQSPPHLQFESDDHGRPRLCDHANPLRLDFNLTNTEGCVALVSALGARVGCDVEMVHRDVPAERLAERHFAEPEIRAMMALQKEQRALRFFEIWTLKEAFVKARGTGLTTPLSEFAFHFDGGEVRIEIQDHLRETPSHWQFARFWPSPSHLLSLACRVGPEGRRKVIARRIVPTD